ncbi:MAG TPA: hypothetical protein VFB89_13320 [Gemmatimonadales bacterium]|nr:hypothetical protein [Gemmatimonadales bacterium]
MAREPNVTLRIRSAECLGPDRGRRRTDQGGRVLDYLGKPNRKMCSLYLSLLDKCGIHMKEFGDSNERLADV